MYKEKGSCWRAIAQEFPGKDENQVKNRFYSTLRRISVKEAEKKSLQTAGSVPKTKKEDLLKYVDTAIDYGHHVHSKRGRKRKHGNAEESSEHEEQPDLNSEAEAGKNNNTTGGNKRFKEEIKEKDNELLLYIEEVN